ncbi:MAG TPA: carboxymuconolactone decarboxylase family protein, partial [Ktedonobacterales bacterium]|nr:carboxymuconolactone decarboxylase family protein [Ktedonobacterales bacterium]
VLSNSLGADHTMWDLQMPALERYFRMLRYDSRGHGASAVPPGPYTIEALGQDALALLVALNRGDELRMRIRAALRNDVTIKEIQDVFPHCAIYCGVPAANAAFHLAEDVLATDAPDQEP